MDNIFKIGAIALIGTILALVLKKQAPEQAMLVILACGVVILTFILNIAGDITVYWDSLAARVPYADSIIGPLLKAAGISIVAKLSAEICRDCEQGALAAKVELAGTAACIIIMFPLANAVFDLIESMI